VEASRFAGVEVTGSHPGAGPLVLEEYLAAAVEE
jgi:hypothetical protein